MAEELYKYIIKKTKETISVVESGEFGAMMQVSLVNEGPFTIVFDENYILLTEGNSFVKNKRLLQSKFIGSNFECSCSFRTVNGYGGRASIC